MPHSFIAIVNRWPSNDSSRRMVLGARGRGFPSLSRSSPASLMSRYLATNSGEIAAREYFPKNLTTGNEQRSSPRCVKGLLFGVISARYRFMAISSVNRSDDARCMNKPRTMSSSVLRPQSSASFFRRKVLITVGQPVLRITVFQVPEGVFTMVGIGPYFSTADENCTGIVPKPEFPATKRKKDLAVKPLSP